MLQVELVYIREDKSLIQMHLALPEGSAVSDAIEQSGIYLKYPETENLTLGIFSKAVNMDTCLQQGDRLEFYRPLTLNPMERRRKHAKKR